MAIFADGYGMPGTRSPIVTSARRPIAPEELAAVVRNFGGPRIDASRYSNERSIISSIYTRIGIDVAAVPMRHVRTDDQTAIFGRHRQWSQQLSDAGGQSRSSGRAVPSGHCHDAFWTRVSLRSFRWTRRLSPELSGGFDIKTLAGRSNRRCGIHKHVRVSPLQRGRRGMREEITLPKKQVAIVENPLYAVMNEPNSTLQRLIRKLTLLDAADEQSASGKLDLSFSFRT